MNRKLLVTLLRKNIQELEMITEGFMEMTEFPKSIILLAQRKTDDIQQYILQLSEFKPEEIKIGSTPKVDEITEPETKNALNTLVSEPKSVDTESINSEEDIVEIPGVIEQKSVLEYNAGSADKEVKIESEKIILNEKIAVNSQLRNDLLSKTETSLSSSLANKKIEDIKQALNIGDRFRFQRELFHGNGEDMNKTLNYINQLATLEEVQSFLQSKYSWDLESETVEEFLQIVRRRFL
ncbi:MAG: hypothetical protein P4L34_06315 [Paludibacter sp.]|nr:hypothetical protein [Paludibacter sp.]